MVPPIIIAPLDRPQIAAPKAPPPPAPPSLDWIDQRIVEIVHDSGRAKTWSVLNLLAEELSPKGRAGHREARMRLLPRVRRLMRLGLLFRAGRNAVATFKPTTKSAGSGVRRRKRTVVKTARNDAVSGVKSGSPPEPGSTPFTVRGEVFVGNHGGRQKPPTEPETESVPAPEAVSKAASALACLPSRPKRWSGWLNDRVRTYRNMRIELPGGEQVYAFGARRGLLVFTRETDGCAGDPDEAG